MQFFMTSEVDHTIGEDVRLLRNCIELKLQTLSADYGEALDLLAIIPMIVKIRPELEAAGFYKERVLFKRKAKESDIRLRIDYDKFLNADEETRKLLIIQNVILSIRAISAKIKTGFDHQKLEADVLALFNTSKEVIDAL